ncbi:MAG TPA: hypothetical protein VFT12_13780 [Thermoanaerobaculia bacterium]|nr:hypothetical protein [Thermoanaerobaculia bacterium]
MRAVGAILAGLAAALVLIAALGMLSQAEFVASMPAGSYVVLLLGWGFGTFAGAFVAARFGRSAAYGFLIGAASLAMLASHLIVVPSPPWMWIAGIFLVAVTAFIAVRSAIPARKSAA